MRFEAEHHFGVAPPRVGAMLALPDFYTALELPDLAPPIVLAHSTGAGEAVVRLRYEFTGNLNPIARRMLGGARLAWIQEMRISGTEGSLTFGAEKDPTLLYGSARFVLGPDAGGCVRHLAGELVVAVPGIASMAERHVVAGLLRRLDLEARVLDERLRGTSR